MTFEWPQLLWVLPVGVLLTALIWLRGDARRKRSSQTLADPHLVGRLVRNGPSGRRWLVRGLQLTALAALLLAAARPEAQPRLPVNRAAVVVAVDASRSMMAQDAQPNRLERARELAVQFVEEAPGSALIGVASFSDSALILVPPTQARREALAALDQIDSAANTSLAAAVVAGVRMLPGREDAEVPGDLGNLIAGGGSGALPDQSGSATTGESTNDELPPGRLLIFSDGVANVSFAPGVPTDLAVELALDFAQDQEVAVYTVPVGSEGGTVSRIDGQDYFIPFDSSSLREISERTGGALVEPDDPDELQALFADLGRVIRWEPTELELSAPLGALAAVVLIGAGALALRQDRRLP